MQRIEVVKVADKRALDDFIRLPYYIYEGCTQYVPDLERDLRDLFCSRGHPAYESSDLQPFVAYRSGRPVGRVVGIVNHKANARWQTRNVRFSLIEFVDDKEVSAVLIDAVCKWGHSLGMDTIEGPMGVTDFDKEGMLVEDFHLPGTMNTIYNPDYYPRHMEALGFQKEVDWVQIRIQVPQEVPARFVRVSHYARGQLGLKVVKLTNDDIFERGYGRRIFNLLNEAYTSIFGYSALSERQVDAFIRKYLRLIDKRLMPVVLNDRQEVVGVAITMGTLTRALQKARGRLWPLGWWHLLRAMTWHHEEGVEMLLVAVRTDYQGLGVNALFFDDLIPIYNQLGYRWAETGPQLEDNVRELSQWKVLEPEYVKRRRCYRRALQSEA